MILFFSNQRSRGTNLALNLLMGFDGIAPIPNTLLDHRGRRRGLTSHARPNPVHINRSVFSTGTPEPESLSLNTTPGAQLAFTGVGGRYESNQAFLFSLFWHRQCVGF